MNASVAWLGLGQEGYEMLPGHSEWAGIKIPFDGTMDTGAIPVSWPGDFPV